MQINSSADFTLCKREMHRVKALADRAVYRSLSEQDFFDVLRWFVTYVREKRVVPVTPHEDAVLSAWADDLARAEASRSTGTDVTARALF
jgi:hypothetical protein